MRDKKGKSRILAKCGIIILLLLLMLASSGVGPFMCPEEAREPNVHVYFKAELDGEEWNGPLSCSLIYLPPWGPMPCGPKGTGKSFNFISVPQTRLGLKQGKYDIIYKSGGPSGAVFRGIRWGEGEGISSTQKNKFRMVLGNWSHHFYFVFESAVKAEVNATLDGQPWSGEVEYLIQGPTTKSGSSVPQSFKELIEGSYTVNFKSGGPQGAVLRDISPAATQEISAGTTATFTLNFESAGDIAVNATLDGQSWSGEVNYTAQGPMTETGSSVPQMFTGLSPGTYNIAYNSGGPPDTLFSGISPAATQEVSAGQPTMFTLNFVSKGEIVVNATLDGQPWSGRVAYTIQGPKTESGSSVPQVFSLLPVGTYTITYNSGGPRGAVLRDISPSALEKLTPGEIAMFTLNFVSTGEINVEATFNGEPWSGDVEYVIQGPETESGSSVPQNFPDMPVGIYTIVCKSGGPEDAGLFFILPSPIQELRAGETITFTLVFKDWRGPVAPYTPPPPPSGPLSGADLSIIKTVDDPTPATSDNIVYTITVTNNGPENATNVQVFDLLPAGVNYNDPLGHIASQGMYDPSTGLWDVGDIPNGGTATLVINVTVLAGGGIVTNTALIISADQTDPNTGNNQASVDINVS